MKKVISILISSLIFIFVLLFFLVPKKEFSYNENRYLTKFPNFSFDKIISGKFTSQLDDYISDNFPCRELLLRFKNYVFKSVGVYKQSDVYYGYDNKLYQEYTKPVNSDKIIRRINNLRNNINVDIDFMLVPTSIYVMSDNISIYNNSFDEYESIIYYKDYLNVNFIDVTDILLSNNNNYLYYGTDHHWTTRGAYLAYLEYCNYKSINCNYFNYKIVNDTFYGTLYSKVLDNTLEYDYIEIIDDNTNYSVYYYDDDRYSNSLYNYDYLEKKDKYSFFLDNNHSLIYIENLDISNNNSILIVKDSYANAFIPMISSNYKEVYVIDPRYYKDSISEFINNNNFDDILFIYNVLTIDDDLGIISIK